MSQSLPLLPLRDIVVFPGMVVPLFVGRDKSVAALEVAMEGTRISSCSRSSIRAAMIRTVTICMMWAWSRRFCSC